MQPHIDAYSRWFPVSVPQPAVGAEFSIPNPGRGFWIVHGIQYRLATSAVVANRISTVRATDGNTPYMTLQPGAVQAASLTFTYSGYDGVPLSGSSFAVVNLGWPTNGIVLPIGNTLQSNTTALDAGDQYSNIVVLVEELSAGFGQQYVPGVPSALNERF